MKAFLVITQIFLIIDVIVLVASVLMQQGNSSGLGAIGGAAETFMDKNKAKSVEGKLELATKISAAVFVVLSILMTALQ